MITFIRHPSDLAYKDTIYSAVQTHRIHSHSSAVPAKFCYDLIARRGSSQIRCILGMVTTIHTRSASFQQEQISGVLLTLAR